MDGPRRKAAGLVCILAIGCLAALPSSAGGAPKAGPAPEPDKAKKDKLRAELKKLPYKIVFETYRDKNWELYVMNADGSNKVNLTKNPKADELYPHASPDGSKICFVADEGKGRSKVRNVYVMKADGTGRTLVATNARQPCWGPKGKRIAYTKGEYKRFTYSSYGTKGLFSYDLASRKHRQHSNRSIHHVCYLSWSPDGKWIFATVNGGMGYSHASLAVEVAGKRIHHLEDVWGCRMDVSADGKKILWNYDDQAMLVANLDLTSSPPKITNQRDVLYCDWSKKVYHGDWSPDGKYIAFSYGSSNGSQHVGDRATGWDIGVADASQVNIWVPLTTGGIASKEPDWLPVKAKGAK